MSLTLGTLHRKMYDKIIFQYQLADYLIDKANDKSLVEELDNNIVDLSEKTIDEVIDISDIHNSLQFMVSAAEKRLAYAVRLILNRSNLEQEDLFKITKEFGQTHPITAVSAEEAFSILNEKLLNGMPCDKVTEVIETSEEKVLWRDSSDIHSIYWEEQELDIERFYRIRSALMSGMINNEFTVDYMGERSFVLKKKKTIPKGIEILIKEHDNILRMLKIVKRKTIAFMNREEEDVEFYRNFINFTRNYSDKHHHGKEEQILFKYMTENMGPVAEKLVTHGMLVEHDMGRYYISILESGIESFEETGSDEARLNIIMGAMAYSDLLKRHVEKENEVVYSFATRSLKDEVMKKVEEESSKFEDEFKKRKNEYEEFLERMEEKNRDR